MSIYSMVRCSPLYIGSKDSAITHKARKSTIFFSYIKQCALVFAYFYPYFPKNIVLTRLYLLFRGRIALA